MCSTIYVPSIEERQKSGVVPESKKEVTEASPR